MSLEPRSDLRELSERFVSEVLQPMKARFVGKDEIIDLVGIALVSGENLFLYGPPGTAKSAIIHDLGRRIGGKTFDYLLTRFTEPSELFGPFDIRKLRDGELSTNTEGMLPEASLVFLDELLNANSAILNSLLSVLNERVFRRGRETRALPVLSVFGASNHLPDDDALGALFDRFMIRVVCDVVPEERLGDVLDAGWQFERATTGASPFGIDDLHALRSGVAHVDLAPSREGTLEVVRDLRRAGLTVSDRRAVKAQRLIAASAVLSGRTVSERSDLWVFRSLWDTLEQREIIASVVDQIVGDSADSPTAHPRSNTRNAPDPHQLHEEISALEMSLDSAPSAVERARLTDRTSAVTSRVEWVDNAVTRRSFEDRVAKLWKRLEAR